MPALFDIIAAIGFGIAAFFLATSSHRPKTALGWVLWLSLPALLLFTDRYLWLYTGKGLIDMAACKVESDAPSCVAHEVPAQINSPAPPQQVGSTDQEQSEQPRHPPSVEPKPSEPEQALSLSTITPLEQLSHDLQNGLAAQGPVQYVVTVSWPDRPGAKIWPYKMQVSNISFDQASCELRYHLHKESSINGEVRPTDIDMSVLLATIRSSQVVSEYDRAQAEFVGQQDTLQVAPPAFWLQLNTDNGIAELPFGDQAAATEMSNLFDRAANICSNHK